jgi:hypothetical protein
MLEIKDGERKAGGFQGVSYASGQPSLTSISPRMQGTRLAPKKVPDFELCYQ